MFDSEAKLLLGTTVSKMIEKELQLIEANMGDADFSALFERKLAFKIEIKDYNLTNNVEFYSISCYTEDSTIIEELEKNFDILQADDVDSRYITISNFPSQNEVCLKDSVSFTDDNGTPLSKYKDVTGKTTSIDLKRNLYHVYDVDELDEATSLSATKQPKTDVDQDGKFKMLIPKVGK